MAKRNRGSRERAGGRTLRRFAAAALVFLIPPGLGADSLNLTTWYPAPYGVYSQLRSTGNSYFAYQGGNVGIGTTSPAAKLQVGSSGDGTVALANAWNTFSSRRFKDDVRPIGGALGKISRLRGVEFRWKGSGKRDLGVVAEEVGQVFPEIVDYETGGRDARRLDYSKLVAPLIEAVKEQQQQIKTQSARIEALEKTLAEVRRK